MKWEALLMSAAVTILVVAVANRTIPGIVGLRQTS